jgi:hypothetical protein
VHHHLSEKDAAKAARKAAQVEKYAVQIRQLDDMVSPAAAAAAAQLCVFSYCLLDCASLAGM